MQRLVVKKLWLAGRAREDREEWAEEVRAHCESCYGDKDETSEVQAKRIRDRRRRGDSLVSWQGRRVQITVDRVLRARGKMMKNNANGPSDCLVAEVLQNLPMKSVYEITHWFSRRGSTVGAEHQTRGKSCAWYSREARRQSGKRPTLIPRGRIDECSFEVVHFGSCVIVARGEGADCVGRTARGRREAGELWAMQRLVTNLLQRQ